MQISEESSREQTEEKNYLTLFKSSAALYVNIEASSSGKVMDIHSQTNRSTSSTVRFVKSLIKDSSDIVYLDFSNDDNVIGTVSFDSLFFFDGITQIKRSTNVQISAVDVNRDALTQDTNASATIVLKTNEQIEELKN